MTVIRWLGQACFLITTLMGTRILIDPPHPAVGYHISAHSIPCNLVFVSHEHSDHNFRAAAAPIGGMPPKFIPPLPLAKPGADGSETTETETGSYTIGPRDPSEPKISYPVDTVNYEQISAYHDNVGGAERGPDTITVIDTGGLRIVHLGDVGELTLAYDQLAEMGNVDVLLIPVGGYYTVNGPEAAGLIAQIKPRVIIPTHYQTPALNADLKSKLQTPASFIQAMRGVAQVVYVKARDLKLSPKTLPAKPTVYILRYQ